mmetsp:Transcript_34500/g.97755  ORF Transcript_34500/g.97755 Transcript_34500/m.97755 type:complete len:98 (+) Transcript_34500:1785-2078(+)
MPPAAASDQRAELFWKMPHAEVLSAEAAHGAKHVSEKPTSRLQQQQPYRALAESPPLHPLGTVLDYSLTVLEYPSCFFWRQPGATTNPIRRCLEFCC